MPRAFAATCLALLVSCATELGVPQPTIDLPQSPLSLGLAFGPGVPARLAPLSQRNGTFSPAQDPTQTDAIDWRAFLSSGFDAGLGGFFARPESRGPPDRVLVIESADLSSTDTRSGFIFTIRYRVRLLDRTGVVLGRSFGTVSGLPGRPPARALDLMYEAVARELFATAIVARGGVMNH